MIEILVGIVFGVISSLLAWWLILHGIRPRLQFSPSISKTPDNTSSRKFRYRIKIVNVGYREIIDLSFSARLSIFGLRGNLPANMSNFDVKLSSGSKPFLESGKNSIIRIYPEEIKIPDVAATRLVDHELLESIFEMRDGVTMQFYAFGTDSFTGNRHIFKSKRYRLSDLKPGFFFLENALAVDSGNWEKPRLHPKGKRKWRRRKSLF